MIRIRILGSAAGGGLPQWNCACPKCQAARTGKISKQTQSSIAFTIDDDKWWLINASPDLPQQIEHNRELQPRGDSARSSPIAGVFLTNADIDHTLGLILMRQEQTSLAVYATKETQIALQWIDQLTGRFRSIEWRRLNAELDCLKQSSLPAVSVVTLKHSSALQLRDKTSKRAALIAPAVAEVTDELADAARRSDVVFFDGTFWSDNELAAFRPDARTAREMRHLPISNGSLEFLRGCGARRKIYTHINNTNPIVMPDSAEREAVEAAGIEIGYDGLEVIL